MKKREPVVFALIVCTIFFIFSCSLLIKEEVLYEVDSNSSSEADITYTDEDGNDVTLYDENLQWSKTISIRYGDENALDEVSLTASTSAVDDADVTATITWTK